MAVMLALALSGCGSNAPPLENDTSSVEQRLLKLEQQVERLEARFAVQPPYRNKAEIQAHIEALEAERSELLTRHLPQHPYIKDIDRRLGILNSQLKMLE
ncbi:hypothetical protein [Thiobacillus sp.]|uniref:hypothetical protein n=1 Tax=Thiobacillus sp. TaxID=924 RepID=UPI00286DFF25|nr:hypothetical protein [Thiobacillus sp.]